MENKLREEPKRLEDTKFAKAGGSCFECCEYEEMYKELETLINKQNKVTGETSDGYHTFNELYEFRKLYNACLFNEWAKQGLFDVHKSHYHYDGDECFGGGWFVVMAELPTGQISNHYENKDWNLFQVPQRNTANAWDKHTAQDVAKRLREYLKTNIYKEGE